MKGIRVFHDGDEAFFGNGYDLQIGYKPVFAVVNEDGREVDFFPANAYVAVDGERVWITDLKADRGARDA